DRNVTGVQTCALPIYGGFEEVSLALGGLAAGGDFSAVCDCVVNEFREVLHGLPVDDRPEGNPFGDGVAEYDGRHLFGERLHEVKIGRASCRERVQRAG